MRSNIILILLLLLAINMQAQEPWKLVKDKNGIQVYTRSNGEMTFKEFKAVTTMTGSPEQVLSVLYDVEALPEWGHNIIDAIVIKKNLPYEQVYYAVAKAPWPYKNRDGIYKNLIKWDESERVLSIGIEMLDNDLMSNDENVRMRGYGHWEYRDLGNGKGAVTFQMQVDPGGAVKAWIANMFTSDSPYETLKGLREVISDSKYKNKTYDFIR